MPYNPNLPQLHDPLDPAVVRDQFNGLKDLIDAVPAGPQGLPGANGADGHSVAVHTIAGDKLTADHTGWTNGDEVVVLLPRIATLVFGDAVAGGAEGAGTVHGVSFVDENGALGSVSATAAAAADLAAAMGASIAANCNCTATVAGATVTITSKSPGVLPVPWITEQAPGSDDAAIPATLTVTSEGASPEPFLIVDDTQLGAEAGYADLQGAAGAPGADGAPGEVSNADLTAAIAGTSSNSNAVATLDTAFSNDPPTLADIETLRAKMNELILALRR